MSFSASKRLLTLALVIVTGVTTALAQVSVRVAPLRDVVVDFEQRAPAEVMPLNDSLLAAEVNAVVRVIGADVGAAVRRGELLVELDPSDFRLQLEAAEAALASARARRDDARVKLDRARRLGSEQYVSEDELLSRETALAVADADIRSARAQAEVARLNLERCTVEAPFDGVIRSRAAQVGAYVTVGAPLVRVTQTDALELDADLPVAAAGRLENATEIWFESLGERWPVRVERLSPVVDSDRRSRRARFQFTAERPPAGRSGEVVWRVGSGQLPASLLSRRDGGLGLFLVRDGTAHFEPLPGAQEGRPFPVDLPPDTAVVVQGQDRLQHGDPVALR